MQLEIEKSSFQLPIRSNSRENYLSSQLLRVSKNYVTVFEVHRFFCYICFLNSRQASLTKRNKVDLCYILMFKIDQERRNYSPLAQTSAEKLNMVNNKVIHVIEMLPTSGKLVIVSACS